MKDCLNKMTSNEKFMKAALREAKKAYDKGECPIGAVIVKDGVIVSRTHNLRETKENALMHAEIIAIDKACRKLNSWRLEDCDMYVTLEPCTMCTGAIIQSRIRKVVFGAYEPKGGAICSCNNLLDVSHGHCHEVNFEAGLFADESSLLMKSFFRKLREEKKAERR